MDLRQNIFKPHSIHTSPLDQGEKNSNSGIGKYKPLPWSNYFDDKRSVHVGDTQFNVYSSGLSNTGGPVFVFHHGAGHSGLTFGLVSKYIYDSDPTRITVVAPDFRAHGDTTGDNQENLSLERQVDDLVGLIDALFSEGSGKNIMLVGHSMGGAVVAHAAKSRRIKHVLGLALIDIVEGSAMDSLSSIPGFISARPSAFGSIESAIRWHIDSKHIQNTKSARLSVPSLVKQTSDGNGSQSVWTWRTDLLPSQKFWHGWYSGLSKTFASAPTAKLLILAGTDRLDKELLIAQMQGKFQLELLPAAGHTIQEDLPERVGDALIFFYKRNQPLDISEIRRKNPTPSESAGSS
ncbi:Protein phosphatase methylesterase 1 [Coemansia sp. RSA 1813]|nr:Protein phosphatase methylesterase 1 [Coemansia sp. RSA 1646]KAJ1773926.1 Protein phosphatase methylesterase 1 [Coemansia sp. RSA 1843]KAJ2089355.1 Protein phosphatase methylesterase 1 [Coemansia sp. RSA 986]KAJ2214457.1 Protein phosphatase methylesterase 1 [Coemansia sp. RSA 487]KAJ2569322.1 Protein phosphatase methylesterase 1 [Coemansia sp. RSA 1813]